MNSSLKINNMVPYHNSSSAAGIYLRRQEAVFSSKLYFNLPKGNSMATQVLIDIYPLFFVGERTAKWVFSYFYSSLKLVFHTLPIY